MAPKATAAVFMFNADSAPEVDEEALAAEIEEVPLVLTPEAVGIAVLTLPETVLAIPETAGATTVPLAATEAVGTTAKIKHQCLDSYNSKKKLLTNRSRSTVTLEVEESRVDPVASSGLTNTDRVLTSSEITQRINLKI
jgi:hypothetical protein